MTQLNNLGIRSAPLLPRQRAHDEYVIRQQALARVLAFAGLSIDQVVNSPIAKNQMLGYYKVILQVNRACEVVELERWWNAPRG